jgi:hypothetical protein
MVIESSTPKQVRGLQMEAAKQSATGKKLNQPLSSGV